WGWMADKPVYCVGILHLRLGLDLACKSDGRTISAKATTVGYILLPWFSNRNKQFAAFSVIRRRARTLDKAHQRASVESVSLSKKIPTAEGRPNRVRKWD